MEFIHDDYKCNFDTLHYCNHFIVSAALFFYLGLRLNKLYESQLDIKESELIIDIHQKFRIHLIAYENKKIIMW